MTNTLRTPTASDYLDRALGVARQRDHHKQQQGEAKVRATLMVQAMANCLRPFHGRLTTFGQPLQVTVVDHGVKVEVLGTPIGAPRVSVWAHYNLARQDYALDIGCRLEYPGSTAKEPEKLETPYFDGEADRQDRSLKQVADWLGEILQVRE